MAWLGLGLAVQAQTCRLTTPATSIAQGRGAMLDVTLANEVEISGGQFTVTLPQGITIKDVMLNAERSTNHTLEYRLEGGNSAKILFYAQPTAPLKGNGGTLCTLALEAASDVAGGEYKVAFSEVRLAVDATTTAEVNTVEGTLKVIPCYTIKVKATEGGSAAGGGVFVEGDMVTLTATPDEGYHFVRWSDGNTTNPYTFVAEADVDLTAEFAPNLYRIVYMVDGEVYKTESYAYGSAVTAIAAPTKDGYTFSGWSGVPATMPAGDVTVSGSFAVNTYMLTYMVDGEKYWEGTVAYGTALTALEAPTKRGHTFSGWSGLPATMPANDVTVNGSFTIDRYTVTFYDWDGTVLKVETVAWGQAATPPADPTREGYTFIGWDFDFTNVVWDLAVNAEYVKNAETVYTVEYHAGANGWIEGADWHAHDLRVAGFASPLYRAQGKVEKLRFTVNRTMGYTKYFCLSEFELYDANGNKIELSASSFKSNADHNTLNPNHPDGGSYGALVDGQMGTYFHSAWLNMPAEDHWIEVTLPNGGYDTFWFRMLSRAYSTENGVINDQSHTFPGEMVLTTSVALVEIEQPDVPELDNASLYHVTLPYRENVSWAVAQGGQALSINTLLGLVSDGADSRQQFAFISNDGGTTHYLYHPAELKYVNKDGSLGTAAKDAVYFKRGVYPGTFVVYFDNAHFINTNEKDGLIINEWGPGGRMGTADGGNSCKITAVGWFDMTGIDFFSGEGTGCVQKVLENGEMFILLPDGSKYTMTGVKVK